MYEGVTIKQFLDLEEIPSGLIILDGNLTESDAETFVDSLGAAFPEKRFMVLLSGASDVSVSVVDENDAAKYLSSVVEELEDKEA